MDELSRIDWNLVPALDALLQERNVSRAARRLSVSQSAASGALARLRRHFGDELLDRDGAGYVLTPLAQQLVGPARRATGEIQGLMSVAQAFDPTTSSRLFTVVSSEYGQTVFGAALLQRLRAEAPQVRIAFRSQPAPGGEPDWLSKVDGWIAPRDVFPDKPSSGLFGDRWVCVADRDNQAVGDALELSSAYAQRWVVPTVAAHRDLPWRRRLLGHGIDLNVAVTTESFGAVPHLVAGTDHIGLVQAALLRRVGHPEAVRVFECPWAMPPLSFTLWWHQNREHDLAHVWFREQVAACMRDLGDERQVTP